MILKHKLSIVPMLALVSLGPLLSGCGEQAAAGSSDNGAKDQFLVERGGNSTPGAASSVTAVPGGRAPGVSGIVSKVEGSKITINNIRDGTASVVQIGSGAKIYKQVTAQPADIKTGETVNAIGTKEGDTIIARTVRIGSGVPGGFGAGRGGFGNGGGFGTPGARANRTPGALPNSGNGGNDTLPNGTPPVGLPGQGGFPGNGAGGPDASGTPGVPLDFVSGTVEKIVGNTITVKSADGTSRSFTFGTDTRLQKEVEAQISDVKEGNSITAMGQRNGDVFDATAIQFVEVPLRQTPTP